MPRGPKKVVSKSDKAQNQKTKINNKPTTTKANEKPTTATPTPAPTSAPTPIPAIAPATNAPGPTSKPSATTIAPTTTKTKANSKANVKAPAKTVDTKANLVTTTEQVKPVVETPKVTPVVSSSGTPQAPVKTIAEKKKKNKKKAKKGDATKESKPVEKVEINTTKMDVDTVQVVPAPPSRLDNAQVVKAVNALLAYIKSPKENEKKSLFEKVESISLVFTLNKIPEKKKIDPYKIILPHPIFNDSTEICLVVGDKKKEEFKSKNLPNVKKLLSIESLRKKYNSYEARDKLLNSYELFFCDSVVSLPLLRFFGKTFIKAKKYPIPIKFHDKFSPAQLVAATRDCTFLYLSRGSCINVKIGLSNMTTQHITENIVQSIEKMVERIPGKWDVVNKIAIKSSESIALPFYANTQQPTQ